MQTGKLLFPIRDAGVNTDVTSDPALFSSLSAETSRTIQAMQAYVREREAPPPTAPADSLSFFLTQPIQTSDDGRYLFHELDQEQERSGIDMLRT